MHNYYMYYMYVQLLYVFPKYNLHGIIKRYIIDYNWIGYRM